MNTHFLVTHPVPTQAGARLGAIPASLRPVTLDDAPLFRAAFGGLSQPVSDASFAASFCWAEPLALRWASIEGHLCLFSAADGDLSMMLPPVAIDPASESRLPAALAACFEIMDAANDAGPGAARSRIEYVSDEVLERIRSYTTISLSAAPMHGDYVYQRQALVDLAGGPLKGKRKLRSKFMRENTGITTADITPGDVPECIELLARWRAHADVRHEGEANDLLLGVDVLRQRDETCTVCYLRHLGSLGLESMTVRVGGRLVAFTIGERLTPTMGVVAVEKTDPGYPGLPQFIYSEFCRSRFEGVSEINAGDDWGIATLRSTKQSYRPCRMLSKSVLTRAATVETGSPETAAVRMLTRRPSMVRSARRVQSAVTVRPAVIADAGAMLAIESAAFSDADDRFNVRQIRRLICNPRARVGIAESEGVIVGWCASLIRQHVRWRSGRVYSVAVRPEHTGRGIGRALLGWSLAILEAEGIGRVYLEVRASNAAAISLYSDFGFCVVARLASYYAPGTDGLRMRRIAGTHSDQPARPGTGDIS